VARGVRGGGGGSSGRATLQRRTWERGSPTCGALATVLGGAAKFDSTLNFKRIQILSSFDRSKNDFLELKNFEIK
jgi:hypothetical protein